VKPNSHTGNADVERFHNTLTEKIRIIYLENKDLSIKDKVSKAIEYYNNSFKETRNEGYIKNYKSLRHKNEPKYRKFNLNNVHSSNIKRMKKYQTSNVT